MLTEIRLQIDDSILLSLKEEKELFAKDMLFHHALRLYRRHKLSLGKAAELAGILAWNLSSSSKRSMNRSLIMMMP